MLAAAAAESVCSRNTKSTRALYWWRASIQPCCCSSFLAIWYHKLSYHVEFSGFFYFG